MTRWWIVVVVLVLVLGSVLVMGVAAAEQRRSRCPGREVNLNLVDVDLTEALALVTKTTGRRFILSGDVQATKITIFSPRPVCPAEVVRALEAALAAQGLTLVRHGRFDLITSVSKGVRSPIPVIVSD